LSKNGIQFCSIGVEFRRTVAAESDGRFKLAVVFDKGGNLRVKCAANLNKTGVGSIFMDKCRNLRDGVAARSGTSLAGIGQNKTGDRFALFLRKAGGVDADLNTHGWYSPRKVARQILTVGIFLPIMTLPSTPHRDK
jgi:hypothetical protein